MIQMRHPHESVMIQMRHPHESVMIQMRHHLENVMIQMRHHLESVMIQMRHHLESDMTQTLPRPENRESTAQTLTILRHEKSGETPTHLHLDRIGRIRMLLRHAEAEETTPMLHPQGSRIRCLRPWTESELVSNGLGT